MIVATAKPVMSQLQPIDSGYSQWTLVGPWGGSVSGGLVESTSGALYVGTKGAGLYKSADGAGHWVASSSGLPASSNIDGLALIPSTKDTLYAIARTGDYPPVGGMYKSTDSGANWTLMTTGMNAGDYTGVISIDPSNPMNILVGAGQFSNGGLFRSIDGGATFSSVFKSGLSTSYVSSIAWDAARSTVYAAVDDFVFRNPAAGVLTSKDSGATWTLSSTGLPTTGIAVVATDPSRPGVVYAGAEGVNATYCTSCPGGLYKSSDAGAHWSAVSNGLPPGITVGVLAIDPTTPSTLYAVAGNNVYSTNDGGAHWSPLPAVLRGEPIGALALDPSAIYAGGANHGVFKSTDRGAHWTSASLGIQAGVGLPEIDAKNPTNLYVMTRFGLYGGGSYASSDGGSTWRGIQANFGDGVRFVLADPVTSGTVWAAGGWYFPLIPKSTDFGATWTSVDSGIDRSRPIDRMALDPKSSSIAYAIQWGSGDGTNGTPSILSKTSDGTSWYEAHRWPATLVGNSIVIDPVNTNVLYLASGDAGVIKSADWGRSWTQTGIVGGKGGTMAVGIDPTNTSILYAVIYQSGGSSGAETIFMKSTNAASTWSQIGQGLPNGRDETYGVPVIDPANNSILYIADIHSGLLYRSTDGGVSWTPFTPVPVDASGAPVGIWAISRLAGNPETFYAETASGLFAYTFGQAPPPAPCKLSCGATVPTGAVLGVPATFQSTATASNCSGAVTYDWNFGDGSPHATTQNPTHAYTAGAFSYFWKLTVSAGGLTCTKSGTIQVGVPRRRSVKTGGG